MTGSYGNIKVATLGCALFDAPANDDFADALVITGDSGTVPLIDVSCATVEASEPTGSNLLNPPCHQTIWYEWTAPANGTATFDTDGSTSPDCFNYCDTFGVFDTTLAVWTGATLGTLVEVASNDDEDQSGADVHWWSLVTFAATMGTVYKIQAGTFESDYAGSILLNWSLV